MTQRFIVFAGESYYARGGWLDRSISSFDTLSEAVEHCRAVESDWWHVVDMQIEMIVAHKSGTYCGRVEDNC
jgi:hypothetical protein